MIRLKMVSLMARSLETLTGFAPMIWPLEASMKKLFRLLPLALAVGLMVPPAQAQELNVGDQAPDFTLEGTDGKTYTLSKDLKGHWLVLAWFPKAYTGG